MYRWPLTEVFVVLILIYHKKLRNKICFQSIETLPQWVRNSPEMRFALSVYSAINTNNYVKFFKLIRQSTLLQVIMY